MDLVALAAKWRVDPRDIAADDAPTHQPMRQAIKPMQRRAPTAEQKRERRAIQRGQVKTAAADPGAEGLFPAQRERDAGDDFLDWVEQRHPSPAKSWNIADQTDRGDGSGDAGGTPVSQSMSDSSVGSTNSGGTGGSGAGSGSTASRLTPFSAYNQPSIQQSTITPTHTAPRLVDDDPGFDGYLVTRCGEHGTKSVGDRSSQETYIGFAKAHHFAGPHDDDGGECWSCCPQMYIAKPGERESGRIAMRKGAPFAGYDDFADCVAQNQDKDDPEAYCGTIKHKVEDPKKTATLMEQSVANSTGQILLKPGDRIRTPTGQTLNIKNVRRHETSRDHYYLDTDAGTSVVPWSTRFQLAPSNDLQQMMPGPGISGANFNDMPLNPHAGEGSGTPHPHQGACPSCGNVGAMVRRGGKFQCRKCGYTENPQGGGLSFSDATQQYITHKNTATLQDPRGAIARRCAAVLADPNQKESL